MYFRLADSMENCHFTQVEGLTSVSEAICEVLFHTGPTAKLI